MVPAVGNNLDLDQYFDGLNEDLHALALDDMVVVAEHSEVRSATWKILIEGGLEAYHFKVAHRNTIGPHFENNPSSYQVFGDHLRSVLPRTSLAKLPQQDRVVWISPQPLAADQIHLRLVTLAPKARVGEHEHWARNHAITQTTLTEDFVIGESIQACSASGTNDSM